jgi:hypothetical protein
MNIHVYIYVVCMNNHIYIYMPTPNLIGAPVSMELPLTFLVPQSASGPTRVTLCDTSVFARSLVESRSTLLMMMMMIY